MIKTLSKLNIEGTYLSIIMAIYVKPRANIMLNDEKLKSFPLRSKTIQICSTLTTFIQHNTGSLAPATRKEKQTKGMQIIREKIKLSLFADDIILYIENPKDSTKKTVITNR